MKPKVFIRWVISVCIGLALNFGIFLLAYQKLTLPFIHEEQRVENAPYIFGYVLPANLIATMITLIFFQKLAKN